MTQRLDYAAAAPEGMKALRVAHHYVANSGLGAPLIDLVYLRVSQINGCAYCIDMHTRDAVAGGASHEKLALVVAWREASGFFTAREQAALAWAEALTLLPQTHAPDADYQQAAAQFDAKELADLTIAIGLMNAYNRIAVGFRKGPAPR